MSIEKPSKNEEEYFAREDAARLAQLREKERLERTATERHSHFMKCPKCGGTLHTEALRHVQVDRCPDCHGIWLDHLEIEGLMRHEDTGMLHRILGDVLATLKRHKTRP